MIYEPLFYPAYSWNFTDPNFYQKVSAAIKANCSWVWFKFAGPYPTMIFRQVFAQPWASIQYMDWSIDEGCWDGDWTHVAAYHDPTVSPLMDPVPVMCGTGGYYFVEWISGRHWRIDRFEEYWQQWPAPGCDDYIDVVRMEFISEWPTRKLMFLAGDLDFCYVPTQYKADIEGKAGIRCTFPLPSLVTGGNFYNYNITLTSRYLYSPFITHLNYGVIAETGIPPDFFKDLNLRKAFSYSVNYTEFIQLAFLGESQYPATPAIFGLPYRKPESWYDANQYYYNVTRATYYFKLAWGGVDPTPGDWDVPAGSEGLVWKNGFKLPLCYNTGNVARKTMAEDEIETHVEAINSKFHIDVYDVEWGTVYLPELWAGKLAMFVIGWQADFPDPHNFFFPFMHSTGAFSAPQHYSDPHVDELIEEGGTCVNETRRQEIYYELQEIYIEDAPSVCTYQPAGRHWERTWIYGWYYNPIYSGGYFKEYWKDTPPGVITVQPVDMSVKDSMSNVTQVIITAHTNPPIINDQKPYLKIVTGAGKGSRPRIIVSVHWDRADSNTALMSFYAVIGLSMKRGTTEHVEGITIPCIAVAGPGDSDTYDFILDLSTLTAQAYSGRWNFSAYINVADETAYDSVLANNTILDNWGIVLGLGDVYYQDLLGLVDISDLVSMVAAVGSLPTDPNWNWYADIYQEDLVTNKVDISDLTALVPLVGVKDYVDPV
jgi:peptide/nickel transport system substrate-binding protein